MTGAARVEILPDVPAVGEFVKGYEVIGLMGIGAPQNTPADIIDRLNKEINAILVDPVLKERLMGLGSTALAGTPADFGKLIREDAEKWAKVIKFAGIKPE